jgi:hypothetical protein
VTNIPTASSGRSVVEQDEIPTKLFFAYLLEDHEKEIKFPQKSGLLKTGIKCPKCNMNTTFSKIKRPYRWVGNRSMRHSWLLTRSK